MYSNTNLFFPYQETVPVFIAEDPSEYSLEKTGRHDGKRRIAGPGCSHWAVMERLEKDPEVYREYQKLSPKLKTELVEFCAGERGLKVTYDPMFKMIFDPDRVPERLEEFIGLCLGEKVTILRALPNESRRLTEEGSLLIMDILVKLESGALVNVEIQRIGYLFPGQRCACYSSDLVMRQYSQVKREKKDRGEAFSYKDIQKVYTIVLIEKSTEEFRAYPEVYIHHAKQCFDSGLELELLQEYILMTLDIFKENHHNIDNKLEAWLYFIGSDSLEDIRRVVEAYPEFEELYQEIFQFRYRTKELVGMYSEALSILDRNTVQLMIERQMELSEKQGRELEERLRQIEEQRNILEEKEGKLEEQQGTIETLRKEVEMLRMQLAEKNK